MSSSISGILLDIFGACAVGVLFVLRSRGSDFFCDADWTHAVRSCLFTSAPLWEDHRGSKHCYVGLQRFAGNGRGRSSTSRKSGSGVNC